MTKLSSVNRNEVFGLDKVLSELNCNWRLCYEQNEKCVDFADSLCTVDALNKSGFKTIDATVPGNFEIDLMREGIIEDPLVRGNYIANRHWEYYHVWYYTKFNIPESDKQRVLKFEGIDTVADIYLNGKLIKQTDNMFLSYEILLNETLSGENELVVHIKPAVIYARQFDTPASSHAIKYMYESLYVRKAAHMYGWDIMPRIVSCGIWKPVKILERKKDRIKDAFVFTLDIYENNTARLCTFLSLDLSKDCISDYRIEVSGKCGDSTFFAESDVWHTNLNVRFFVSNNCKLWWPKGYGEQNLYDTEIRLYSGEELCDVYTLKTGIRMVSLINTEVLDSNGNGDFHFEINRKRIFIKGTNWLPLDALHSRDIERLPKALELLDDIGCNMVRCWGGNVYENDEFYDFCDEKGILVWQDFAMGCAVYPQERRFFDMIENEAKHIVKRLRNHPSLAIWCGDNEGDICYQGWLGLRKDPNKNVITREILPRIVETHDFTRPFLKSSPYVSQEAYNNRLTTSEQHPWGPRNYFKIDYYKFTPYLFASEIGFYGMPSLESMKKFISKDKLWPPVYDDGTPNEEWLAHCTSPEPYNPKHEQPFTQFVDLISKNIVEMFGEMPNNLEDYILQSQIFQAEAFKYIIEKFRTEKDKRSGVIWWNLINGWPQIDNGIVDYYYDKKLAYEYIKRCQEDICFMIGERDNKITLYAVNDTFNMCDAEYSVTDTKGNVLCKGSCRIEADGLLNLYEFEPDKAEQKLLIIKWEYNDKKCINHYLMSEKIIEYKKYTEDIEKAAISINFH